MAMGGTRLRSWLLIGALVLAAAAVVVAASRAGDLRPTKGRSESGGPVPWAALPPTHPHLPVTRRPASPDPRPAEHAPRCRIGQLSTRARIGGAGGTMYDNIHLRLAHGRPCAVSGIPAVTVHTVDGATVPGTAENFGTSYRHPVLVTATTPALLQIAWPSACFDPHDDMTAPGTGSLRIVLPGDDRTSFTQRHLHVASRCRFEPTRPLGSVGVGRFAPAHLRAARVHSAYAGVAARMRPTRLHGTPGRPVDFTVTLRSRREVVLEPCPDYTVTMVGLRMTRDEHWALNCALVPHRNADGPSFLPAGVPVTFAMRVTVPPVTAQKFIWTLDLPGPDDYVGTFGTLTVR
jgi:hypothetical protein